MITTAVAGRPEDIEPLCAEFLDRRRSRAVWGANGCRRPALRLLASCSWPGNVRQLQNILERAALFADTEEIGDADLLPLLDDSRELTAPGESLEEIGAALGQGGGSPRAPCLARRRPGHARRSAAGLCSRRVRQL